MPGPMEAQAVGQTSLVVERRPGRRDEAAHAVQPTRADQIADSSLDRVLTAEVGLSRVQLAGDLGDRQPVGVLIEQMSTRCSWSMRRGWSGVATWSS